MEKVIININGKECWFDMNTFKAQEEFMRKQEIRMFNQFRLYTTGRFLEIGKIKGERRERQDTGKLIIYGQAKKRTMGYLYKGVIYKAINYTEPTWIKAKHAVFIKYPTSFDF